MPRLTLVLVILFDLLFLVLAVGLAWCNRLAGDDFLFLAKVRELGVAGTVVDLWMHWTGRWSSSLLISWFVQSAPDGWLFAFNTLTLALLGLSLAWLLHEAGRRALEVGPHPVTTLAVALLIEAILFFAAARRSESWYWLSGTVTYLWPLILLCAAGALFLSDRAPGFPYNAPEAQANGQPFRSMSTDRARNLGCAALIGLAVACNEAIALLVVVSLITTCIARLRFLQTGRLRERDHLTRLAWPLLTSLVSAGLLLCAPGNQVRRTFFPTGNLLTTTVISIDAAYQISSYFLSRRGHLLAAALLLGCCVAQHCRLRNGEPLIFRWPGVVLTILAVGTGTILLAVIPAAVGQQSRPPSRAWEPISVILVTASMSLGFLLGLGTAAASHARSWCRLLSIAGLCAGLAAVFLCLTRQLPVAREYARAYDERYRQLLAQRAAARTGELRLRPLPPSGWLPPAEISPDPAHWRNQELRAGLSLPFPVRLDTR